MAQIAIRAPPRAREQIARMEFSAGGRSRLSFLWGGRLNEPLRGLCDKHHLRRKKTINTDGEFVMAQSPQQPQQSPHERFKKFPLVHHHEVKETFVDQLGLFMFDGGT